MGNRSNRELWAGRERLLFIERAAWWRGVVNRGDLREVFGISAAQASADLQGYLEVNPGALSYNLSTKRYEARPEMACVLHEPRLEEAVRSIWGEAVPLTAGPAAEGSGRVEVFSPPQRRAGEGVERRVFLAVDGGLRLGVKYWSVKSARATRREIAPHALAHDGYRWHARAWCFESEEFRDFVLSRMEEAEWPGEEFTPPVRDEAWEKIVTVTLRANPELEEEARKGIERDYGMKGGRLRIEVREAMREYVLGHLRVPVEGRPRHLEVVG